MLTILVFEIKEGKNAQKVKKNINRNLSIRGIILRGILLISPPACMLKKAL
jgi:hypothetical protein